MAYALLDQEQKNREYQGRAFQLLKAAVAQNANDTPAVVALGYIYGSRAEEDRAVALLEAAVRADPSQVAAANNLAAYLMNRGREADAGRLWVDVLRRAPGFEAARMNLAVAQFRAGDPERAHATLLKGLELNPRRHRDAQVDGSLTAAERPINTLFTNVRAVA